jgi:hypothetical protein
MFKTRKGLLAIILLSVFWYGGWKISDITKLLPHDVRITDEARMHILRGDERGGGHAFGAGKPCKSEFPATWSNDEIIEHVQKIAANDNLKWKKQDNGYYVSEQMVSGVKVRVVLDRERDDVVTAYPLNTGRNPCVRKPANDNKEN